jgi:tetratricopeptide (TPR) repeat protein
MLPDQEDRPRPPVRPEFKRAALAAIFLFVCCWGIWASARAGFARMLSNSVKRETAALTSADQAIRLSPTDPKTYAARAYALATNERFAEAAKDYETAVALRPDDHLLWLRLGHARQWSGDQDGALAAYNEAVRLAPFYAQPRWYLGKLLLRMGRDDDGFTELRRAATSDPSFFPDLIERAWQASNGDAQAVAQATQPQTPAARLELARFFVEHGKAVEARELFHGTSGASDEDRSKLLTALLAAKQFAEAYEVWVAGREARGGGMAAVTNGGFESEIALKEPGFGWQPASNPRAVRIFLDTGEPRNGTHSLRVDWSGDSDPSVPIISQLVLVEPQTRYRLNFAVRTQELLTIGLPLVAVIDASDDKQSVLAQSSTFPRGTSGWQDYAVEFTTSKTTNAVLIAVRRQNCSIAPCAVLGHVWVDNFELERL